MALPAYEQIRNRSEREFQARVLAAVASAKPKRSRFAATVNSPAFIWLMSAIGITLGGFYFTSNQQCFREADRVREQHDRLSVEIQVRRDHILRAVQRAEKLDQLSNATADIPYSYLEYKNKGLFELQRDFARLESQIKGPTIFRVSHEARSKQASDDFFSRRPPEGGPLTFSEIQKFGPLAHGRIPADLTPDEMPRLKLFANEYLKAADFEPYLTMTPNCSSPFVLAEFIMTGRAKLLTSELDDFFSMDRAK